LTTILGSLILARSHRPCERSHVYGRLSFASVLRVRLSLSVTLYIVALSTATMADWGGHRDMLHDVDRNRLYAGAIQRAVARIRAGREATVVTAIDIGTGSSLLACYAAQAGARVTAFEVVPPLARLAACVVRDNGHSGSITVLGMHSTEVQADPTGRGWVADGSKCVLPEQGSGWTGGGGGAAAPSSIVVPPADLLVHELLDTRLMGEGLLPALRHAWAAGLLRPGAECVPRGAVVYAQAVACAFLRDCTALREEEGARFPFVVPDSVRRCRGVGCVELNGAALVGQASTPLRLGLARASGPTPEWA